MVNDSSTGGYLLPADAPAPEEDAELDGLFQDSVRNITGLPGSLVRPRWQPGNPKQPEPGTDWCAIGVMVQTPDAGPAIQHRSENGGADKLERHEEIEVLASFYGPRRQSFAAKLRDGLSIPQNMETLQTSAIGLVGCGPIRSVPELVNQQWIRRSDMLMLFRRKTTRIYPVQNIEVADIHLFDDTTHVDEIITVPTAP
jgi:hypothetical protein